ncbi:bleomycin resistance protein [Roseibium sp. Sym1]|uniref:bleomycin resistance protein n=1 Tax=Roseibium sp. Sym1 TaxID=3016006 RepID=UPI0022B42D55|nr:VOC family protein [Roseibium sp. Sym1]
MPDPKPPQLSHIAPVLPVADLKASLAYYRDKLLFETRFEWADTDAEPARYAILARDHVELHLSAGATPHPATAYCFVDGVDGYYAEVKAAGANVTEALADQPWEMREFETRDPDGNVLVFGEHCSRIGG